MPTNNRGNSNRGNQNSQSPNGVRRRLNFNTINMTGNASNESTNYNSNTNNGNVMIRAIQNKRIRDVDMLLERFSKRDLHRPVYRYGFYAPYATFAALHGYRTIVKKIMERMNNERAHEEYTTPLFAAVENGDMKMIETLETLVPRVNPKVTLSRDRVTVMHAVASLVASSAGANRRGAGHRHILPIVRKLVSMGTPVDKQATDSNQTRPLQLIVQQKCRADIMYDVAKTLLESGAKANAKLKQLDLHTPMKNYGVVGAEENFGYIHILIKAFQYHQMTSPRNMEILDVLIRLFKIRGANINAKTSEGHTPLMFAAMEGNNAMIHALLRHGASVSIKNKDGKKASDLYAASARRSNRVPNANVARLLGPLTKKTYNKSIRLQNNMNTADPISLNTVNMNNAYVITKDIRPVTQKRNGRNERVKLIQRMYNKSSINGLMASGRSLISPITRQPFSRGNIAKVTDIVHPDEIKRFRNLRS